MSPTEQTKNLRSLSEQYAEELRTLTASCSSFVAFLDSLASPDHSADAMEGTFHTLDDYVALRDRHESFMDLLQKSRWSFESYRELIMESLFSFIREGCND